MTHVPQKPGMVTLHFSRVPGEGRCVRRLCVGGCRDAGGVTEDPRGVGSSGPFLHFSPKKRIGAEFPRTHHARDTRDAHAPMRAHMRQSPQRELLGLTSHESPNVQTAVWGLTPIGHTR